MREDDYAYHHCGVPEGDGRSHKGQMAPKWKNRGRNRAFMFQNYALFPWLKVGENIEYPMRKMKIPKNQRKERLKELLEMAQLTEYEHYYIHEISGGMKQRVALLRALACDPRCF